MEFIAIVGVVLGLCLVLSLFAILIRFVLVRIAKHNGFTANEMPMHYHMFAMGVYVTGVFLVYLAIQLA